MLSRDDQDEEIVASGQALQVVAGWLGIENANQALQEEPDGLAFSQPRPQGLGLGAKYLPHHKGLMLTAGVQQRLGNRLRQSKDRALQAAEGSVGRSAHLQKRQRREGAPAGAAGAAQAQEGNSGGSSDESEGRGAAFDKQRQQRRGTEQRQQQKAMRYSKQDLLGSPAGQQTGGKRKKKKRCSIGDG